MKYTDPGVGVIEIETIGVLNKEGMHSGILPFVDVIFPGIQNAFEFFIDESIFKATMKK